MFSPQRRLAAVLLWLTFGPLPALAQSVPSGSLKDTVTKNFRNVARWAGLTKTEDQPAQSVLDLFGVYLQLSLGFVGVIFVVQVVHGGYLWMTAGGNEEQVKKARSKIANGAVGAAIIFLAYLIAVFALTIIAQQADIPDGGGFPPAS
jgi:hypothetical protein